MLTAKSNESDTITGLELGADDYIAKPARLKELVARVKANLKKDGELIEKQANLSEATKTNNQEPDEIILGNLKIISSSCSVLFNNKEIEFTQREFDLLKKLALSPNRVFSREQLLEEVWGWSFVGESRTVDVHIRYLREKLEKDAANPEIIKTVRGRGYKLIQQALEN